VPQASAADVEKLVLGDTAFAASFWAPAASAVGAGRNVVLSPYSASATLTMVDVGAAGSTDTQIESVLHLPGNGASLAPAFAALECGDETDAASGGNQLLMANAVWGQQGMAFAPTFLSVLATGYGAPMQQADFAGNPGGAVDLINAWISKETAGTIPGALQPGDVDMYARIALVNAVYFKGTWATAFETGGTAPRPFTLSDGTRVMVPTMSGNVAGGYKFLTTPRLAAYELAYSGGALVMDFLVPADPLDAFEASLTADSLQAALGSFASMGQSQFFLPKFSFTTRLQLSTVLQGMGISDAFTRGVADFSGMDGAHDLFLSAVIQQAFVAVDENGTVASAATVAVGSCDFATAPTYSIDSPFLFLIRDKNSGHILFMGRVEDPRQ
jgi:serpin B